MTRPAVPLGRVVLFWSIALGGAAFDLATKSAIFAWVGDPDTSPPSKMVIRDVLELRTSYNPGALWGFMRGWPYASLVFAGLSVVAGVAIVWWLFVRRAAADGKLTVALGLIMAGALGNCYDRLAIGRVRDFVYFHVDPIGFECAIFNFADNMLVAGALILMVLALKPERSAAPEPAAASEGTAHAS
jgi:signal peptidase II